MLGGKIRFLVSGAAPIAPEILDYLKMVFCVPILEGFG
jgi:long-chain acyl-CoA synthetase